MTTLQGSGLPRLKVTYISETDVSGHMLYNIFTYFLNRNHTTDEEVRLKIEQ
jgi:hypothetical protein